MVAAVLFALGLSTTASAGAPVIGVEAIDVVLDESNDGFFNGHYDNHFDLDHPKELWFNGIAEWRLPTGTGINQLFIQFDYLDVTGQEVLSNQRVIELTSG